MADAMKLLNVAAAAVGAAIGWYYEARQGHPYAGIIWGAIVGGGLFAILFN